MPEENPFKQTRKKKAERPTIEDLGKATSELFSSVGTIAGQVVGAATQIVITLPQTQEVNDLRERIKAKIHEVGDAL